MAKKCMLCAWYALGKRCVCPGGGCSYKPLLPEKTEGDESKSPSVGSLADRIFSSKLLGLPVFLSEGFGAERIDWREL